MAPEQMEGSHAVDHRADIYSLGVVFYEMLTGEVPMGHFEPPSKKVEIDVRLDEVVLRALEREPERRYQHASDVKTDVESISHTPPPAQTSESRRETAAENAEIETARQTGPISCHRAVWLSAFLRCALGPRSGARDVALTAILLHGSDGSQSSSCAGIFMFATAAGDDRWCREDAAAYLLSVGRRGRRAGFISPVPARSTDSWRGFGRSAAGAGSGRWSCWPSRR